MRKLTNLCDKCNRVMEEHEIAYKISISSHFIENGKTQYKVFFDYDDLCLTCFNDWKMNAFNPLPLTTPEEDFLP